MGQRLLLLEQDNLAKPNFVSRIIFGIMLIGHDLVPGGEAVVFVYSGSFTKLSS
jgi:hypothetical protein